MSVVSWPDHLLSLDDWDALPEDTSRRYEVAEGVLQVSPRPASSHHQWALVELAHQMHSQLPVPLRVLPEVETCVFADFPVTVRVPDLIVVPAAATKANPVRYPADAMQLAVEVVSPGTVRTDKITKFAEYADAGIEHYWIVDLDPPPTITVYRLIGGDYETMAETADILVVDSPAPLHIDVTALTL
jgi:Uma2 family endonuclease